MTAHMGRHKPASIAFEFCLENTPSKRSGLDSPGEESTDCSSVAQSTIHFWETASDTQANPKTLQMQGSKYTAANQCRGKESLMLFSMCSAEFGVFWKHQLVHLLTGGLKQQLELIQTSLNAAEFGRQRHGIRLCPCRDADQGQGMCPCKPTARPGPCTGLGACQVPGEENLPEQVSQRQTRLICQYRRSKPSPASPW